MKSQRNKGNRKKSAAPASLAPKLAAYSATAAAALAFAPNAQAQIINITSFNYSGNTNTTTPPSFSLPLTEGRLSFTAGPFGMFIQGFNGTDGSNHKAGYLAMAGQYGQHLGFAGSHSRAYGSAYKLKLGSILNLQPGFFRTGILAERNSAYSGGYFGFQPGKNGVVTGYLGLKGVHAGHTYYGWLNVKVTADANGYPSSISLVAKNGEPGVFGAYEDAAAPGINSFGAGDAASVPEPADAALGLGLLAFGAAGVREMRRRRKKVV